MSADSRGEGLGVEFVGFIYTAASHCMQYGTIKA